VAKIRTIKPQFWTSEQVMEVSPLARLLFIGLWNFCDDKGVHPVAYKTLKAEVFPADDITVAQVTALITELIRAGLLGEFSDESGRSWWCVTGWHHQLITRPAKSRYPSPPHRNTTEEPLPEAAGQDDCESEEMLNASEQHCHDTATTMLEHCHDTATTVMEGKGREGKGKERKGEREVRASRLPADWQLPADWLSWAMQQQPTWTPEHAGRVAEGFRDYWIAKPGKDGTKADWFATWRNWVRREFSTSSPPSATVTALPTVSDLCDCGKRGTMKLGGRWYCDAHVPQPERRAYAAA